MWIKAKNGTLCNSDYITHACVVDNGQGEFNAVIHLKVDDSKTEELVIGTSKSEERLQWLLEGKFSVVTMKE